MKSFWSNVVKLFSSMTAKLLRSGGPERTRISDLYRVKAALSAQTIDSSGEVTPLDVANSTQKALIGQGSGQEFHARLNLLFCEVCEHRCQVCEHRCHANRLCDSRGLVMNCACSSCFCGECLVERAR